MPIVGAHMLLYTPEADALRAVLRDALGWDSVEDTPGWLIFKLPPAELGVRGRVRGSRQATPLAARTTKLAAAAMRIGIAGRLQSRPLRMMDLGPRCGRPRGALIC